MKDQRDLIGAFLRDHDIDLLLVQETMLKPHKKNPNISNYRIIRLDRSAGQRGGGTLIYYRRSLHVCPVDTPELTTLEATVCRIAMTGHPDMFIASCYQPGSKSLVGGDISALFGLGNHVLLAGDFNSKHPSFNCKTLNPNGTKLFDLMDRLTFDVIAPLEPTHYPRILHHQPDVLDFALLRNISLPVREIAVKHELNSDHRPVILRLGSVNSDSSLLKTVTDWDYLHSRLQRTTESPELERIPPVIRSKADIDVAIDAFSNHLQLVVKDSSRQVPATDNHRWKLPEDMKALLRAKNAATRAYDYFPSHDNRSRLRSLQRLVKEKIKELRSERWDNLLSDISPSHTAFWSLSRALKSDTISEMPPLTRTDRNLPPAFNDDDKAELLADSLETQCSPSTESPDQNHIDKVDDEVQRRASIPPVDTLDPVTVTEVKTIIKDLHSKRAPGCDGISNRVLKNLSPPLIILLVSIFNACLANCIFPDIWKIADVIGFPKTGKDRRNPTSYRPISLLISLGKVYERLIQARLKQFVFAKGLIPAEQFGFRAGHSCTHQVHRITEHVLKGFARRKPKGTAALFFDLAKAFDKVWHNGLVYKLYDLKLPDRLVLIIKDFLSNRLFRYRVEGTRSSLRTVTAGVPQGSVLAPLLFSLYTSDIPRHPQVSLALYADDTAIYVTDIHNHTIRRKLLQDATDALGDWFRKWRMDVNPEKSTAVYFSRTNAYYRSIQPNIRMFGKPIPWANKVKYLGVTLDCRLNFKAHINKVRNKAAFYLCRLAPLIRNPKLSLRSKVRLYLTCIRPVMTYASVVFAHSPSIARLQVIQNRFLRRATGAPYFVRNYNLHKDLQIPTIRKFIKDSSTKYFDKSSEHLNPLISSSCDYTVRVDAPKGWRRPKNILTDPDDRLTARLATAPLNIRSPHSQVRVAASSSLLEEATRRRRRSLQTYNRFRHVPGRFTPPPTHRDVLS